MRNPFVEVLEDSPIIAAVKDMKGLEKCLDSDTGVVFILFGDICNIADIIDKVRSRGKIAMIHMDLINGLSGRDVAVDFIKTQTKADGIITTKQSLIKHAKEVGLYTVLRFFVIDSMSLVNIEMLRHTTYPDVIEILPGIMPKVIKKICSLSPVPVIAGGLITDKEDIMSALSGNAISISTTNQDLWFS